MQEQVYTLVKIPLTEIEEWLRAKYILPSILSDFRIEEKNLVITFTEKENTPREIELQTPKKPESKRRSPRKRNRMKTRGWGVVARITNSRGQQCTIYQPFVEALQKPNLTIEEQKKIVEGILRSNKNKPSEDSVQYFLENTLEYLKRGKIDHVTPS